MEKVIGVGTQIKSLIHMFNALMELDALTKTARKLTIRLNSSIILVDTRLSTAKIFIKKFAPITNSVLLPTQTTKF
jgi:hypothetical protein